MFMDIDSPYLTFVLSWHLAEHLEGFKKVSVEEIETVWDWEGAQER